MRRKQGIIFTRLTLSNDQEGNMQGVSQQEESERYEYSLQKGGATKTEKCFNFSIAAKKTGKRVLVVDADQGQGNTTQAFGYIKDKLEHSLYTLIVGESTPQQTILATYYDPKTGIFFDPNNEKKMNELGITSLDEACQGPDLLPMSTIHCKDKEYELIQQGNWGQMLSDVLDEVQDQYDEMHIDTSPDIDNIFSKMAIYAATSVVIPLVPEARHVDGLSDLAQWVMKARLVNKKLKVAGIIFSRVHYKHHTTTMTRVKEVVIPQINKMVEATQGQNEKLAKQLAGLYFICFDQTDRESKIYGEDTSIRANILSAPLREKKSEMAPVLEVWGEYVELLKRTKKDFRKAASIYNSIFDQYEQS